MVSADLEEFYRVCIGELDEIELIPAIRTGPMLHEKFRVPRSEICLHRSFTEVAYPFIRDYAERFQQRTEQNPQE